LTEIVIPNSVTSIGRIAFSACTSLMSVTFQRTTPPTLGESVFINTHSNLRIFVPAGNAAAYRAVANLSTWRNRIHHVGCPLPNQAAGSNCSCS
jgi:sorbitol-specific phosphotransferase system component IIA